MAIRKSRLEISLPGMRQLFRAIRRMRFNYTPLLEVRIHRDRLLHNLRAFREVNPGIAVAPVLKSNAYGHGLIQVAGILKNEPVPFLAVDSYYEALILRNEHINLPVLIIGYTPAENIYRSKLKDTAYSVVSIDELRNLSEELHDKRIFHLKFDTGMHRQGILPEDLPEALALVRRNPNIVVQGIYSHLADADGENSEMTDTQIRRWNRIITVLRKELLSIRHIHLAATAGSFRSKDIDANVIRLGIGLYGIATSPQAARLGLRPALELCSRISSLRTVGAGEKVGYNATFTAPRKMTVATVPAGYHEGVDRRLSGNGYFIVRNISCPILGRVSMNITSIDVTAVPGVQLDEAVTIIGAESGAPNSVVQIAERCKTIPYEILVHIPSHLRRAVIKE